MPLDHSYQIHQGRWFVNQDLSQINFKEEKDEKVRTIALGFVSYSMDKDHIRTS